MDTLLYIFFFLLAVALVIWRVFQLNKMISHKITGEAILIQVRFSFPWLKMVLSILLFLFYYFFPKSTASFGIATSIVLISITDYIVLRRLKLVTHAIKGETIIENNYKQSVFNLAQVTRVEYYSLLDSFEIFSQDGNSIVFSRKQYEEDSLTNFVHSAIAQSKLSVVISEKAKNKGILPLTNGFGQVWQDKQNFI